MTRTQSISVLIALLCAVTCAAPARADRDDDGSPSTLTVTGDFNGDGIADVAILSTPNSAGESFLTVLLGQRDGSFQQVASRPSVGHEPRALAVGDLNRDGHLDLIVGDADGAVIELLGDGSGILIPNGVIGKFGAVESIAVGDFNRDGMLDVAVSDSKSNSVSILLGSGDGQFRPIWAFRLPMQGKVYHLATADFNGDGIPDLAVSNQEDDTFDVMLGNGNGTFTYAAELSHFRDPNAHCTT
jgi:hypothetical protein